MSSEEEKLAREQERLLKSINSKSDIQAQMKKKKEEAERKKKLEEKKKKEEEDRRLGEEKRKEELRIKEENRRKWLEQEAEEERKKKEQEEQKKTVSVQAAFDINEDEQLKKEEARMMKSMTEFFGGKVPQQSSTTKNPPNMNLLNYDPDSKTVVEKEEDRWAKQFGKATILETPPVNPLLSHKHETTDPTGHETAVPPAPPVYIEGSVVVGNSQATVGTNFESDVWSELNKARMNPHQYANTLIELVSHYEGADGVTYNVPGTSLKRKTQEGVRALHEAIKFLQHATPCPVLELSPGFSLSAQELVSDQSKTGDTSTKLSDGTDASVRLLRYGFWKKKVAELLSYGAASPKDVVHQWLLDDGNKSRPNRKTLFDPELKVVGISSGAHPSFGRVVVACITVSFTEGETRLAPTLATSDEFVVGNFFIPSVSTGPERVELDTTESRTDVTIQVVPSKYPTEATLKCKSGVVEFSFKHEEEIGTVAGRAKASIVSTRTVKLPFAPEKSAFSISTQDPSKLTVKINKAFRK